MRVVCRYGLNASWRTTMISKHRNEVMPWHYYYAHAGVIGTLSTQQLLSDALANERPGRLVFIER